MAESGLSKEATSNPESRSLNQLRTLAQQHLQEIDQDKTQEQEDDTRKMRDLERYAKRRRGEKPAMEPATEYTPLPKMRTAQGKSSHVAFYVPGCAPC